MRFNFIVLASMLICFAPEALCALEIMRSTKRFDHDKASQLSLETFILLNSGPWRKICQTDRSGKTVLCQTSQETRVGHSGIFVLSLNVWEERKEKNSTRHLRIDLPAGISVADGGSSIGSTALPAPASPDPDPGAGSLAGATGVAGFFAGAANSGVPTSANARTTSKRRKAMRAQYNKYGTARQKGPV